jgi:hypothetical protein
MEKLATQFLLQSQNDKNSRLQVFMKWPQQGGNPVLKVQSTLHLPQICACTLIFYLLSRSLVAAVRFVFTEANELVTPSTKDYWFSSAVNWRTVRATSSTLIQDEAIGN